MRQCSIAPVAFLAIVMTVGACELVAGIGDRNQATSQGGSASGGGTSGGGGTTGGGGVGGAGGAGGQGATGGGGTGGGASGGGGTGGTVDCGELPSGGWPDSTSLCSNGTAGPNCPPHAGPEDGDLELQPQDFRLCDDAVVYDAVTGLYWAAEPLHAVAPSLKYDDAFQACAGWQAGGYDDWRLPTLRELSSLLDHGVASPVIASVFSAGDVDVFHWSSSAKGTLAHWGINFNEGAVSWLTDTLNTGQRNARCVRGDTLVHDIEDLTTTIQDHSTGLEWDVNESNLVNWEGAFSHCAIGNGWRLPTAKELLTLFAPRASAPYMVQPFTQGLYSYWSSTPYQGGADAWNVDFNVQTPLPGLAKHNALSAATSVARCVRPIP